MAMIQLLGAKFKLIPGYQGAATSRTTAMERGELQGTCGIYVSTLLSQFGPFLKDGRLRVVLQMGLARHPAFKDVPNALELAHNPEDRQAFELLFAQLALGRPFVAPPDVPADRVAALRQAFDATMEDPELVAEMDKRNLERRWFGHARMTEILSRMKDAPASAQDRIRKILGIH
jgi:tripartite-type tricarboxylate transporter receptor subunit TctC